MPIAKIQPYFDYVSSSSSEDEEEPEPVPEPEPVIEPEPVPEPDVKQGALRLLYRHKHVVMWSSHRMIIPTSKKILYR